MKRPISLDKPRRGFTLVELLIVIVVLAILVAASVVAYNGIQNRAETDKTAAAVREYIKALTMYKIDNGVYPTPNAMCLGENYPNFGGATPACRQSNSIIQQATNASQRDLLKPYMGGNLPMPSTKPITASDGTQLVGAWFYGSAYNFTVNSEPYAMLYYVVSGSSCPVGPLYVAAGGGAYTLTTNPRSGSIGADGSYCLIMFPTN